MEQIKQQVVYIQEGKEKITYDENSMTKSFNLKPTEGYFFTEVQLRELLENTFDSAGKPHKQFFDCINYGYDQYEKDKQEYINKLLSK